MIRLYDRGGEELEVLGSDYLAVSLAGQICGIDYTTVQETRHFDPQAVITVPGAPAFVQGAGYTEGRYVPLVDLPGRLGLGAIRPSTATTIVFARLHGGVVGWVVDQMLEVRIVQPYQVSREGTAPAWLAAEAWQGSAAVTGYTMTLVDWQKILTPAELTAAGAPVELAVASL